ncbi:MAG: type II toxin-antitoxin system RelE/ParE family toxin [Longimicrobiales bacterium]
MIADPRAGDLLVGTGGFRKLRVPLPGRGKSGGGRVVYYFVGARGRVYLVGFFPKNVKENLTKAERDALKAIAQELEAEP